MRMHRADLSKREVPGRLERTADALICRVGGHVSKKGTNGWENFGTGIYCGRCSTMLNPDGSRFEGEPRMHKSRP